MSEVFKICSRCKEAKDLSRFYKSKQSKDGFKSQCKYCHNETGKDSRIKWQKSLKGKSWHKEYSLKAYLNNKKEAHEKIRIYSLNRRRRDPVFRMKNALRKRLSSSIRRHMGVKTEKTMYLTGCSMEFLKNHMQSMFCEGMSWVNYGKWHIDHIKPLAAFDLSNQDHQRQAFHFSNLQPLWAKDNLKKRDNYVGGGSGATTDRVSAPVSL